MIIREKRIKIYVFGLTITFIDVRIWLWHKTCNYFEQYAN